MHSLSVLFALFLGVQLTVCDSQIFMDQIHNSKDWRIELSENWDVSTTSAFTLTL